MKKKRVGGHTWAHVKLQRKRERERGNTDILPHNNICVFIYHSNKADASRTISGPLFSAGEKY